MLQIRTTVDGKNIFLDLYQNEPVLLNMSFAELQDITKKNSNFSQTFTLPGSKKNNIVFNFFYELNAIPTDFNPNNKFEASLLWDGYEIMHGNIRLNSVSVEKGEIVYSVSFYNQIGDLMSNIGDKFLFDLDLTYLNHPYSQDVILYSNLDPNLFSLTGATDYSYQNGKTMWGLYNIGYEYISGNTVNSGTTPLVQFTEANATTLQYTPQAPNFDFTGSPVHDYYFKPSIQIKELYSAVVNEAGYEIESSFFDTSYFKRFYMPLKFVDESIYSRNAIAACYTYTNETIPVDFGYDTYTNPSSGITCNSLGWTATTTSFNIPAEFAGTYQFRFTFTVVPRVSCDPDIGVLPYLYFFFEDGTITETLYPGTNFCDTSPQPVSIERTFNISGDSQLEFYFQGDYIDISGFTSQIINPPRFIPNGSIINYDIEFPPNDYSQIDFITSVNKYFNLIVVPNPDYPKKLIIEPIVDYVGSGEILDWTTKVDANSIQSLYPTSSLLNGTLHFEFKLDQDYANQDFKGQTNRIFGTDKFQLNLDYKDAITKFDFLFSSPIDITVSNSFVPLITLSSMSKVKTIDNQGKSLQTFVPFKILPKMVFRGLTLPNDNYGFIAGSGTTATTTCASGATFYVSGASYPLIINYNDCDGVQQFYSANYTGSHTLPGCANPYTLYVPFVVFPYPIFYLTSAGTTCNLAPASQYQYWYMNDLQQDRWTNINRFTTYPFNYNNFSHYTNFRGEDKTNITPSEFTFINDDLYNIYYQDYIDDIISEENKIYSTKIYLYPQDIQSLTWKEKILINNTYFRINKITNWNALEPAVCDIELVKLTKDYQSHPILYYDLIPCSSGATLHSNSDLNYNLYAYAGTYVKLYDDALSYLGCYSVSIGEFDPLDTYNHYYIGSGYTSTNVGAYPDCGCTGRTPFNIVQEEPDEDRVFYFKGIECNGSDEYNFTANTTSLNTALIYKIKNPATDITYCISGISITSVSLINYDFVNTYANCVDCNFVPPTPSPTQTNTSTPTNTPSPTPTTPPVGDCFCYDIIVSATTSEEGGFIASITYNDCFGVLTGRAFTTGPGTYQQCIQRVGGVVQYFSADGINESSLTGVGNGNCNTGYVCTGYVPLGITPTPTITNTMTPTPSATIGLTPTATPEISPTPTQTPTETINLTPTPTATPVPSYTSYYADRYQCLNPGCSFDTPSVIVALPSGTTPEYGKFYYSLYDPGFSYMLDAPTIGGPALIIETANFTACNDACINPS